MGERSDMLWTHLAAIDRELGKVSLGGAVGTAVLRWRTDGQATLFHLRRKDDHPPLVGILGGTGTGKSTMVNRLLEASISATSVRRTFTSGAIAIARQAKKVPEGWLSLPREAGGGGNVPVRGQAGKLIVVELDRPIAEAITLVDTADLDGDQPLHHAEADRVFRWAEAVVFVVTPEKYQMTELLPYYRLARRYGVPALFVMNKCEEAAVLEDYREQLKAREWADARVFAIPRDDAAYEPAEDANLGSLRRALMELPQVMFEEQRQEARRQAMSNRLRDLLGRLQDQILAPMDEQRREVERLVAALRAMAAPAVGVDVSPATQQLQRRLQEQSVLYLMGPQRILDRVRQVPGLLARLPRTAWDVLRGNPVSPAGVGQSANGARALPDFPKLLADQFIVLQSRIDDLLMTSAAGQEWINSAGESYRQVKMPPADAGKIAEEELAGLKAWLEQRWHGTPRDTAILMKLLRVLPGGKALTKWSEAAPYLLTVIVATHHAFFGHIDLLILGSFTLATWLGEKLSNEVTSRTRQTNRQIAERFARLAREQIERVCVWLEQRTPGTEEVRRLERMAEEMGEMVEEGTKARRHEGT